MKKKERGNLLLSETIVGRAGDFSAILWCMPKLYGDGGYF